jgi:hypothetical protein
LLFSIANFTFNSIDKAIISIMNILSEIPILPASGISGLADVLLTRVAGLRNFLTCQRHVSLFAGYQPAGLLRASQRRRTPLPATMASPSFAGIPSLSAMASPFAP